MPKTVEELEAELKRLEEKHSSELAAKDTIIEERDSTIATLQEEKHALETDLDGFRQAEFDEAITEYTHTVWEKLSEDSRKKHGFKDPKDWKREELNSVWNVTRSFKAALETQPPVDEKNGTGRSMPPSGQSNKKKELTDAQFELIK